MAYSTWSTHSAFNEAKNGCATKTEPNGRVPVSTPRSPHSRTQPGAAFWSSSDAPMLRSRSLPGSSTCPARVTLEEKGDKTLLVLHDGLLMFH